MRTWINNIFKSKHLLFYWKPLSIHANTLHIHIVSTIYLSHCRHPILQLPFNLTCIALHIISILSLQGNFFFARPFDLQILFMK